MGWSAAKAAVDAAAAASDSAARATMERGLVCMGCLLGRAVVSACGFGSGSREGKRGVRAQGDYRAAEGLNQGDLVIENPKTAG